MTNWLLRVSSKKFGITSISRTFTICRIPQGFLVSQMKLQLVILMILMTLTPMIILSMDNVSQLICRYVCIDLWTYNNQKKSLLWFTSHTIPVQYCDIMRFVVLHNRHHKVSQSVSFFMHRKTVTILLRIRARGHFVMSITKTHESHYVGVLDNPPFSLARVSHGLLTLHRPSNSQFFNSSIRSLFSWSQSHDKTHNLLFLENIKSFWEELRVIHNAKSLS